MNLAACDALHRRPVSGTWVRISQPRYLLTAHNTYYTTKIGSRFKQAQPPEILPFLQDPQQIQPSQQSQAKWNFQILYTAMNEEVAQYEAEMILGDPQGTHVPAPNPSGELLSVEVELHSVVDLTDPISITLLDTSFMELTGIWKVYTRSATPTAPILQLAGASPTQQLGAALFMSGVEGFLAASAKHPNYPNLVIFPENLWPSSNMRFSIRAPVAAAAGILSSTLATPSVSPQVSSVSVPKVTHITPLDIDLLGSQAIPVGRSSLLAVAEQRRLLSYASRMNKWLATRPSRRADVPIFDRPLSAVALGDYYEAMMSLMPSVNRDNQRLTYLASNLYSLHPGGKEYSHDWTFDDVLAALDGETDRTVLMGLEGDYETESWRPRLMSASFESILKDGRPLLNKAEVKAMLAGLDAIWGEYLYEWRRADL